MNSPNLESNEPASPPVPRRRGRKLHSVANWRAALASIFRRVEAGQLEVDRARALIYAASTALHALSKTGVDEKLDELEKKVEAQIPPSGRGRASRGGTLAAESSLGVAPGVATGGARLQQ